MLRNLVFLFIGLLLALPAVAQTSNLDDLIQRYGREAGPTRPLLALPSGTYRGTAPADVMLHQQTDAQVRQQSSLPIERESSIDGSTYSIIAPIFLGQNGNTSYIRYWNITTSTVAVSTTVVGWPSGAVYGTAVLSVPFGAAPQYSIFDILTAATGSASLRNGDEGVTLYLPHNPSYVGFQHVIYNGNSQFFENVSLCQQSALAATNSYLMNVHTSSISGYPSMFYIHNYKPFAQNIKIYVLDGRTGALRGTARYVAPANDTAGVSISTLERDIGWTPGPNDFHYNLLFANDATNTATSGLLLGQVIFNAGLSSYVNMSLYCDIR